MQIAIVYSSRTGNTAQLAAAIKEILPEGSCKFYGALTAQENATQLVQDVDLVFVGFGQTKEPVMNRPRSSCSNWKDSAYFYSVLPDLGAIIHFLKRF